MSCRGTGRCLKPGCTLVPWAASLYIFGADLVVGKLKMFLKICGSYSYPNCNVILSSFLLAPLCTVFDAMHGQSSNPDASSVSMPSPMGRNVAQDIHQQLLSAAGEDLIEQKWERNHHRLGFVLLHHRTIGIRAVKPVGRESDIKPQVRSLILT